MTTQCMAKMHTYALRWLDKGRFVLGRVPNVLPFRLATWSNWQILRIPQTDLSQVASTLRWVIGFCVNSWMPLGITPLFNSSASQIVLSLTLGLLLISSFNFQLSVSLVRYHLHSFTTHSTYNRRSFIIHSHTVTFHTHISILSNNQWTLLLCDVEISKSPVIWLSPNSFFEVNPIVTCNYDGVNRRRLFWFLQDIYLFVAQIISFTDIR